MTNWTKEQQDAIRYHDRALLVAAAAGSGKTAVLVQRIFDCIKEEEGPNVDELLVVTFTKAAAAEMRQRIGAKISENLELDPLNKKLQQQMTLLNQSSIMTIDSFCRRVMDENFHLVDLDPGYTMLGETEGKMLGDQVLDELLDTLFEKESDKLSRLDFTPTELTTLVDTFSKDTDDEELKTLVKRIWTFSRSSTDPKGWIEKACASYSRLAQSTKAQDWYLGSRYYALELLEEMVLTFQVMVDLALEEPLLEGNLLPFLQGELAMIQKAVSTIEKAEHFDEIRLAFEGIIFARLASSPKAAEETKNEIKNLRNEVRKAINSFKESWLIQDEKTAMVLIKEMAPILENLGKLTLAYYDAYQEAKRKLNKVDFADVELAALSILTTPQGEASQAALKYQDQYVEILIDEYQDSNDLQEAILMAISRGKQNVFMVGDVKQSIYRFRQAKPRIFLDKYKNFGRAEDCSEKEGRVIQLYRNFRSRPEVLEAVNCLFKKIMSEKAGELDYSEEEALTFGADYEVDPPVPVTISVLGAKVEDQGDSESDEEEVEDRSAIELEGAFVASKIKELVSGGAVQVKGKNGPRPLTYRDIVILMRSAATAAPVFEQALEKAGVPVFADAGTSYFETVEIQTVMALLRVIDNPLQDIPLLATLRSPMFSFTEEEFIKLRGKNRDRLFYYALEESQWPEWSLDLELKEKVRDFLAKLTQWRDLAIHMPIDQLIWHLYSETAYLEYVGAMPDGDQRQANLKLLFKRAGDYEESAMKGLYQFIRAMDGLHQGSKDESSDARIIGESENVVRITTIHKSKGLEYPVVFLVNSGKGFNTKDIKYPVLLHEGMGVASKHISKAQQTISATMPYLWLKELMKRESLAEEMRILYVAMTRAKERLFITGTIDTDLEKKIGTWQRFGETSEGKKISPFRVNSAKSYLDWIMPVVLNEGRIKSQWATNGFSSEVLTDGETFTVELLNRQGVQEKEEAMEERESSAFWEGQTLKDPKLLEVLNYRYGHEEAKSLPSTVSVSFLKKRAMAEGEDIPSLTAEEGSSQQQVLKEKAFDIPRPEFMKQEKELTGAERGTAFHNFMLHIDPMIGDEDSVERTKRVLVEKDLLSSAEVASVSTKKVLGFLNSDLGHRFRAAYNRNELYREELFYLAIAAKDLLPQWSSEDPINLIGIIDAFFEENNEIVLLDYKTDAIRSGGLEGLAKKYETQIYHYAKALETITGQRVKEAYLYSTSEENVVSMNHVLPNKAARLDH